MGVIKSSDLVLRWFRILGIRNVLCLNHSLQTVCVFSCCMPTRLSFVLFLLHDSVTVFKKLVNTHSHTHQECCWNFLAVLDGWVLVGVSGYKSSQGEGAPDKQRLQTEAEQLKPNRMLRPSIFQPSSVTMRPFLDLHWPVRSLWPETRPLFYQIEQEMIRHMHEMRQNMEYMERLHQKIFEEIDSSSSSTGDFKPIAYQELGTDGSSFALSLDTKEFSPKELSVKQVGRKLRVSGRMEKKQDDGKGSYSYRCQEFRQELDLPDGIDPETITCSLVGGRLQIQAPRERAQPDGKERIVPITVISNPAITSSTSSSSSGGLEGGTAPSESSVAEKN